MERKKKGELNLTQKKNCKSSVKEEDATGGNVFPGKKEREK